MPTSKTPSLLHRAAAYDRWKQCPDRTAATAPAREAFYRRFEDEVDPDRKLSEAERTRRAEFARRAFYARIAAKSVAARSVVTREAKT